MAKLIPTRAELHDWILQTVRHCCHVEYYLRELGIGDGDPERPHDIVGEHNKFELDVMHGLAMCYRCEDPAFFEGVVQPALCLHRRQHHHRMWNCPNDCATSTDMKLGATDAICSMLEPRKYQGGVHTFTQIARAIEESPTHNRPWMREILVEFRKVPGADIERRVESLDDIPNVGIDRHVHGIILQRVHDARTLVREHYGHRI